MLLLENETKVRVGEKLVTQVIFIEYDKYWPRFNCFAIISLAYAGEINCETCDTPKIFFLV